ncbi:hypothetical protein HGB07_00680 [Candidatus Roizmanbacteria bacterium]|nr:hypothetical protein [Candidatus Roizmanbacteria bacterium]
MDTNNTVIHGFDTKSTENNFPFPLVLVIVVAAIIIGGLTGVFIKTLSHKTDDVAQTVTGQKINTAKTAGIADKKTFKDKAEGTLREGGIDGEGTFHLERPGGDSQNVYLTSSTVDLSNYIGKKVRVWGATFNGQKAGWLMDVGLVEVLQ